MNKCLIGKLNVCFHGVVKYSSLCDLVICETMCFFVVIIVDWWIWWWLFIDTTCWIVWMQILDDANGGEFMKNVIW